MLTVLIAVASAIAGTLATSFAQLLADRRRQALADRRDLADALATLLAAVLRQCETQWLKVAAAREQRPDTPEARVIRYAARTAASTAVDRLMMTTADPDLLAAAQKALDAANELGDIELGPAGAAGRFTPDVEAQLTSLRSRTRRTRTALRALGVARIRRI
ncbi:hypothetical protein [Streptomyces triticirhizae]|uniref:Protein kilB n=1 Tax=Streptomyces triticirhizae TaxID=2483353 RepID=A0A3M2LR34_9ACTN|nr:hypothetical protein [Streptomyces triticirhizae]RMI39752.1 hypothetical protein EBN88_14270 [Streptomyces triticirhizae]